MNQNKPKKRLLFIICLCVFTIFFAFVINSEKSAVVDKQFHQFDEYINDTVVSNLTRKIFPPMVRTNPIITEQFDWPDGPYWQHIPPLYMYVPLPFFYLMNGGASSIDAIRMAYITVTFLACLLFIGAVFFWEGTAVATISATIAAICFMSTWFTQQLIVGSVFNNSDIVLFFGVVCSFFALAWYLKGNKERRLKYPLLKIIVIAAIVTMPIVIKSVLGAIPPAIFLGLLLYDRRKIFDKAVAGTSVTALVLLVAAYLPLYFSSPDTFLREIVTPLYHLRDYEFQIEPWHYFITSYLPDQYLGVFTVFFYIAFLASLYILYKRKYPRHTKNILLLTSGWFIWNLVAISIAITKSPNFIFQSYLFVLFFVIYSVSLTVQRLLRDGTFKPKYIDPVVRFFCKPAVSGTILVIAAIGAIYTPVKTVAEIMILRQQPQPIDSVDREYDNFAETMKGEGVSPHDLFILYATNGDCIGFKFYLIFYTGAESEFVNKIYASGLDGSALQNRYGDIHIVIKKTTAKDLSYLEFPHQLSTVGIFSEITIKNKDIPEDLNKYLGEIVNHQDYKIPNACTAYPVFDLFGERPATTD